MKDLNEMFEHYTTYFSNINKKLKVERSGRIKLVDQKTWEVEVYQTWEDLEKAYDLTLPIKEEPKPVNKTYSQKPTTKKKTTKASDFNKFKYWVSGDPNRWEELRDMMIDYYRETFDEDLNIEVEFKKPDWVYYLDHEGYLCQTNNTMVIDLLKYSNEWKQLVLPPKQFTKEEIAKMIGMPIDQFEIV